MPGPQRGLQREVWFGLKLLMVLLLLQRNTRPKVSLGATGLNGGAQDGEGLVSVFRLRFGTHCWHLFSVALSLLVLHVTCSFPFYFALNQNCNLPEPCCSGSLFMVTRLSFVPTNKNCLRCRRAQVTSSPVPPRSAVPHISARDVLLLIVTEFVTGIVITAFLPWRPPLPLSSFVCQLARRLIVVLLPRFVETPPDGLQPRIKILFERVSSRPCYQW